MTNYDAIKRAQNRNVMGGILPWPWQIPFCDVSHRVLDAERFGD